MKKMIAILCVCLLCGSTLFAQEAPDQRWTVRTSTGYFPSVPTVTSLFGAIFVGIAVAANEENNETLEIGMPPYFSIDAYYHFNTRWAIGMGTGYTGCVWKVVDKDDNSTVSSTFLNFIPLTVIGRCTYMDRPAVKLYGSLEAGAMFAVGGDFTVVPDIQLNPIGVEFGRRFFGMAEMGVGMNYFGGRLGIGYRF